MKVLFVCSGNFEYFRIYPVVEAQAESLKLNGINIEFSIVKGKGLRGYLKHIWVLRKLLKRSSFDIIHAHYSFCGIISYIAKILSFNKHIFNIPIIVSLMGSDIKCNKYLKKIISLFISNYWDATIVKSSNMKQNLGLSKPIVIPNGVNLDMFKPIRQDLCRENIRWDPYAKIILFGADTSMQVKNYSLAINSFNILKSICSDNSNLEFTNLQMKSLGSIPHCEMPIYINACDVVFLSSKWEGSPNIIKEAMACNKPIVCTDVGDVSWLLEKVDGCFITTQDPNDIANKLKKALEYQGEVYGREKLLRLKLDSESSARSIIEVYKSVLIKNRRGNVV